MSLALNCAKKSSDKSNIAWWLIALIPALLCAIVIIALLMPATFSSTIDPNF